MTRYASARPRGVPCWFDLMSPDVERAAAFYGRLFGWRYDAAGEAYGFYHLAKLDGRNAAGIGQMPDGAGFPSAWTVYMMADDADAMAKDAEARGGTVTNAPFEVPGMGRMAVVHDPGGAVFGLWQPFGHHGADVAHEPGAMGWCEANVPDADVARDFYTGLLGLDSHPLESEDMPTRYHVLSKDGESVAGLLQMNEAWQGVPPHWMAYFEVRDADEAARVATEAGGGVGVAPFDSSFGRIAVLTDPFGAVFSVNATRAAD